MNTWRLIISSPAPGAWNMAVDEALLENAYKNPDIPTLRLYSWNPYAVSLGHAQPYSIYHQMIFIPSVGTLFAADWRKSNITCNGLTYSLVFNENNPNKGWCVESYRKISEALISGVAMRYKCTVENKIRNINTNEQRCGLFPESF